MRRSFVPYKQGASPPHSRPGARYTPAWAITLDCQQHSAASRTLCTCMRTRSCGERCWGGAGGEQTCRAGSGLGGWTGAADRLLGLPVVCGAALHRGGGGLGCTGLEAEGTMHDGVANVQGQHHKPVLLDLHTHARCL